MGIKIVERGEFTVVGMKYRGRNENNEIPQMWEAFGPRVCEIKNMVTDHLAYGISANMDKDSGEFDYIAGFEVSSVEDVPEGMVSFQVPGGKYAVFSTTLPAIGDTFQQVCKSDEKLAAVFSIGKAETFGCDQPFNIEAHVLTENFQTTTAQYFAMDFVKFIRGQLKFDSKSDLAAQIKKDCQHAKELFEKLHNGEK